MSAAPATADERLATTPWAARMMRRPEVGAAVAALIIFAFFSITTDAFLTAGGASTWLESSAQFGIMAVAVALLMIGGEFDLSAGAMVGTTGLVVGVLATRLDVNIWVAVLTSLVVAALVGMLNGWLVVRTRLPSFIVTLGTFFVLQGINLAGTKLVTGQVSVQGFSNVAGFYDARWVFGSSTQFGGFTLQISVIWWLLFTAMATWFLLRTRPGNWIFAVGGDENSARQVGVPVMRTKIGLFMTTALAAWLVGMLQLFKTSTVQASTGVGQEFIYIICAVVGGCLLTGGYGSAIGAALGALIYGMTLQGIVFAQWDNNWLKAFLGVMLLGAVLVNNWIRQQAEVRR
ncbi:MAG TPA: ABC transporter permease [Dermatophilaceae bacterium]|nr:ABC transporter permease [Dermatophilaceae bacterium]